MYRFALNEIENLFRIDSDEFGLARIEISEWVRVEAYNNRYDTVKKIKARVYLLSLFLLYIYRVIFLHTLVVLFKREKESRGDWGEWCGEKYVLKVLPHGVSTTRRRFLSFPTTTQQASFSRALKPQNERLFARVNGPDFSLFARSTVKKDSSDKGWYILHE